MRRPAYIVLSVVVLLTIPVSTHFGFFQSQTKEQTVAPDLLLNSLSKQVSALGNFKSLQSKIDLAAQSLREADSDHALVHLKVFQSEVKGLMAGGSIDPKGGEAVLDAAIATQLGIQRIVNLPAAVLPPPQTCANNDKCVYLTLYVSAPTFFGRPSSAKPDGSPGAPYPTIAEAIAQAFKAGACGLTVRVGSGHYPENIAVSLPLRIQGAGELTVIQGSIIDYGGFDLSISDVQIQGSASPGAVVVDGCPSQTRLAGVRITGATRSGVFQRGGSLSADVLDVRSTVATSDDRKSGAGVRLSGGVHAVLTGLYLSENGAAGLVAEGRDTAVYLGRSTVSNNEVNRYFPVNTDTALRTIGSGVVADDGANLLMELTIIDRNQFIGLYVRGGAVAHNRYSIIERTSMVSSFAGFNAVNVASTLQLTGVTVMRADVVDILASNSATLVSNSRVELSPILYSYFQGENGTDIDCLRADGTVFIVPERGLLFGFDPYHLELPCPECPPPPPRPCVRVPFDCWWCASTP